VSLKEGHCRIEMKKLEFSIYVLLTIMQIFMQERIIVELLFLKIAFSFCLLVVFSVAVCNNNKC